jgi:signal transduction histidine kinase
MLLAASGVRVANDELLAELGEFRGVDPQQLVDAHPVLRAFAVAQALEHHGRAQAEAVAGGLFALVDGEFGAVLDAAQRRVAHLLDAAGIVPDGADDWLRTLWQQAQIAAFSMVLGRQADAQSLVDLGRRIARTLFGHEPRLFVIDRDGRTLLGTGDDDLAALRLPIDTSPSVAARAVREGQPVDAEDAADVAVTDRQMLRRFAADRIQAVPLRAGEDVVGALVFRLLEDDDELRLAMAGFAAELGHWLGEQRRRDDWLGEALVQYRARHEKRLREIVHEANNPLSIVNNYLHILELRLKDHPETHEQIRLVGAEIRRAAAIFRKVSEFPPAEASATVAPTRHLEAVDVNGAARAVLELALGNARAAGIAIEARLESEPVSVRSDRNGITQVLTNLVRNAIEAMGPGGTLTLETASGVYRAGRAGIELVVRDTGPGLPDDVLASLYAPKRSRKGGEHAGLGLHITARLVDELEGAIDVRTAKGRGTSFTVFLPNLG